MRAFLRMLRLALCEALPVLLSAAPTHAAAAADPFTVHRIAVFSYPWRIAFLPDGRMLVTEKPGRIWLVTQAGAKTRVAGGRDLDPGDRAG